LHDHRLHAELFGEVEIDGVADRVIVAAWISSFNHAWA
jgi:hypothetical protein